MPGTPREKRVLIPWLTPMRAARGPLRQIGVLGSFFIHLAGLLFLLLAIFLMDHFFWGEDLLWEVSLELKRSPAVTLLVSAIILALCEGTFLLLGYLTTCFGAGIEPLRQSLGRSIARWYQLTPWIVILILALMLSYVGIDKLDDWYWDRYYDARWGDYYDEHGYDQPMQLLTRDRFKTLMRIAEIASLGIFNLLLLWWILGTVAVHRIKPNWPASCRWPAVCEGCGYALAGLTYEQGCPECGQNIGASKYADRDLRDIPSLRLMFLGLFWPSRIGTRMATRKPTKQPLRVLLWGILFAVLCGPVLMLTGDLTHRFTYGHGSSSVRDFGDGLESYVATGLTVGTYAALIGGLLLLGAGTLVATIVRVMGKRNIMPAASKAACYSAGLLPIWVLAQAGQLIILIPLINYLRDQGQYSLASWAPASMLLVNAAILTYLTLHIARITKAARHANI